MDENFYRNKVNGCCERRQKIVEVDFNSFRKNLKGGENMNKKQTSKSVATKASQILSDGRYSSKAKSVAGSALAQTKTGKKK